MLLSGKPSKGNNKPLTLHPWPFTFPSFSCLECRVSWLWNCLVSTDELRMTEQKDRRVSLWSLWTNPGLPTSGLTLMREELSPLWLNHYILESVHFIQCSIELASTVSLFITVSGLNKKSFYFHTGDRAMQMIWSYWKYNLWLCFLNYRDSNN